VAARVGFEAATLRMEGAKLPLSRNAPTKTLPGNAERKGLIITTIIIAGDLAKFGDAPREVCGSAQDLV